MLNQKVKIKMSSNAELWSRIDEASIRRTLIDYLKRHFVDVSDEDNLTTEELRDLYIDIECGKGNDI